MMYLATIPVLVCHCFCKGISSFGQSVLNEAGAAQPDSNRDLSGITIATGTTLFFRTIYSLLIIPCLQ